jgi:hypothetical protein
MRMSAFLPLTPVLRPALLAWLPASAANLRPFLVMAVNKVLEDPSCVEVLYARLN